MSDIQPILLQTSVEMCTLFFVVFGALSLGIQGLFGVNIIEWMANHSFAFIEGMLYTVIGVSALLHIFSRDYYLRFLGHTAFPCGSLVEKIPLQADTFVDIVVEPNVNIIYWAAEVGDVAQENPWIAYNKFSNAGVTRSDDRGNAILRVRKPGSYKVRSGTLQPHVHYRTCKHSGMLSRVHTVYL